MRKIQLISTLVVAFWVSCDNPVTEEQDITPPEIISVTKDKENPVYQIVNIYCTATDNMGIKEVQLWINSEHYQNMIDIEIPYSFALNTSENDENGNPIFEQGIIYNIQLKVIDLNGNASFSDPSIVQFFHRTTAYIILIFVILLNICFYKYKLNPTEILIFDLSIFIQIFLGIVTLLNGVDIKYASLHQIGSIFVLSSFLFIYFKNYKS